MKTTSTQSLAIITASVALTLLSGCSESETKKEESSAPTAATVNYPLAYFAGRIAGDSVAIEFPAMDGDPAFWEPKTNDIIAYQNADLILLNGAGYAKWVPKVSLSQAKLVDTSTGFGAKLIPLENEVNHTHGPEGAHAHGDVAFTTWLDPQLAIQQAAEIRDAFATKWPDHQAEFERGYQDLVTDLNRLDTDSKDALGKFGDSPLIGSHPVYQYLARRYALNMTSVHWEPDAEPDDAMWQELDALIATHPAKIMLWEGEPLPQTVEKLSAKGIKSIVFDPCGNRPDAGDYLQVMESNLANLKH